MMTRLSVVSVQLLSLVCGCWGIDSATYWAEREAFVQAEQNLFLGSQQKLTPDEERANIILMAAKGDEFERCFNQSCFPPARHFFVAKQDIEASQVFSIIKRMPKGSALHGHDTGMVSTEWVVSNVTYRPYLYTCTRPSQTKQKHQPLGLDLISTIFSLQPPEVSTCQEGSWTLASDLRLTFSPAEVDEWFAHHMSLFTDHPYVQYSDSNDAWLSFQNLFQVTGGMLTYMPVFRDYYTQTMQELLDDNIQYLELRGVLPTLYDLNGTTFDFMDIVNIYAELSALFQQAQPAGDWLGARFIYAPPRNVDNATADTYVNNTIQLSRAFPDFIAGFDLVGEEDIGKPYVDFIDQLLQLREEIPDIKYFFHAGETNWQGLTDMNIIDALLLNTTRIGHGFAITKHPLAVRMAKERGIAIEVNPISNQVLELVEDLRNHPVTSLLADNFPVVVSCDDPSFWGAKAMSYDYYQMFMGMAGRNADLKFLKQLAINSFTYSAMGVDEKKCAFESWNVKWAEFIASVLNEQKPPRTVPSDACTTLWRRRVQLLSNQLH